MATNVSPRRTGGSLQTSAIIDWLRQNLFNGWVNSIISVLLLALVFQVLRSFIGWALTTEGWIAVFSNLRLVFVGRYPVDQVWRVELIALVIALITGLSGGVWKGIVRNLAIGFAAVLALLMFVSFAVPPSDPPLPVPTWLFLLVSSLAAGGGIALGQRIGEPLKRPLIGAWLIAYPLAVLVIYGGVGLSTVGTDLWGGLMLTLLLSISGIVLSFPLGVLLALGRRSNLPVIKGFCIGYIELIRGVPLITVLFMASIMLPLFLPNEVRIDAVLRAMVAITLFSAAYLAENVRGGLQSLPRGQTEAARALGLNTVQTTLLITLPQALRAVVPVLVGQFIALFKDTSLVAIVGLTDLLGMGNSIRSQPEWLGIPGGVWRETFFIIALIYWVFSFTMSRTSRRIEEKLNVGGR